MHEGLRTMETLPSELWYMIIIDTKVSSPHFELKHCLKLIDSLGSRQDRLKSTLFGLAESSKQHDSSFVSIHSLACQRYQARPFTFSGRSLRHLKHFGSLEHHKTEWVKLDFYHFHFI